MSMRNLRRISKSGDNVLKIRFDTEDADFLRLLVEATAGSTVFNLHYPPFGPFAQAALVANTPVLIQLEAPPSEVEIEIEAPGSINLRAELSQVTSAEAPFSSEDVTLTLNTLDKIAAGVRELRDAIAGLRSTLPTKPFRG